MKDTEKIQKIDIRSEEYPALLKGIKDPPEILYCRGEWNAELFGQTISVVGSRRMTRYGATMAESLVKDIAGAGITVISGFMYGIDAKAHEAALEAGGRTIAVMPCGIERIHPDHQVELYGKILGGGGLILSEYPGAAPPALWTYPRRNRIVAGLAPLLLVIEAGIKSGALITARIAKRYNKKIYALPGPLTSPVSKGTALLLKQGAFVVTGSEDILNEYGRESRPTTLRPPSASKKTLKLNRLQRAILNRLFREAMSADEITRELGESASRIGAELTVLTLKKVLVFQDGRYTLTVPDLLTANSGGKKC